MIFAQVFFEIYDRKIAEGEISFKTSGIDINDFNQLCIVQDYKMSREAIEKIKVKMKLTEEEYLSLLSAGGYELTEL